MNLTHIPTKSYTSKSFLKFVNFKTSNTYDILPYSPLHYHIQSEK